MTLRPMLALATLALLTACGGGVVIELDDPPPAPQPRPNPQPVPPTPNCSTAGLAAAAQSRWPVVCMLTSSGEMVLELYDSYELYVADTRRHRAVKELRDLAWAAGATSDSLLLASLSGAQQRMREVA